MPKIGIGSKWVNYAGVKQSGKDYFASGGRVLSCSAMAYTLTDAAELAYELISTISLEGAHFRTDIGGKAL